jgi:hypothetical protein
MRETVSDFPRRLIGEHFGLGLRFVALTTAFVADRFIWGATEIQTHEVIGAKES